MPFFFQNFVARAVEGENPTPFFVRDISAYAVAHFARGFIGEGDGKDMLGRYSQHFGDIYVSVRQHARFTASCARRHAHISFRGGHSRKLVFVQTA